MGDQSSAASTKRDIADSRESAARHSSPPLLRFLTCGSVDDGKSTLIGRMLHEQNFNFGDQLVALERDSRRHSIDGDNINYALLADGLASERQQGITIDVAYRNFSTPHRSFAVADAPGHAHYTRNLAAGASSAQLAVILVDARKGLLPQTLHHSIVVSLLGIRHVILAVNKLDLVGFDQAVFGEIASDFRRFTERVTIESLQVIPISARHGDNVSSRSARTPWYQGPHLFNYLETVDVGRGRTALPFRMAVQGINPPDAGARGLAGTAAGGTIASGSIRAGDGIVVAASGSRTRIARIVTAHGDIDTANAGDAVTIELADHVDAGRGDLLVDPQNRPQVADQFTAHLIWMSEEKLLPGRSYLMQIGGRTLPASVTEIKHRLDVNTLGKLAAKTLALNEIGYCNLASAEAIAFDPYAENHATGSFILSDRFDNTTAAVGLIDFGLRRATNIHLQDLTVSKAARAALKQQQPAILWFTGLSGAGKSVIANLAEARLHAMGAHTTMLDGDNVRHGLNKDLGFTEADRVENIRRVGEVARLMTEAGLIVLCAFISPFRAERRMVRDFVPEGQFIEIFVDTPLDICISRDPKGLYKRAISGQIKNFTGIDQAYEVPEQAEIHLAAAQDSAADAADRIVQELIRRGILPAP
jgi:bifunctional enzyme CysN/CysC